MNKKTAILLLVVYLATSLMCVAVTVLIWLTQNDIKTAIGLSLLNAMSVAIGFRPARKTWKYLTA